MFVFDHQKNQPPEQEKPMFSADPPEPEPTIEELYRGRCGNCHKLFEGDEPYCRYCGTRRGDGAFEPFKINFQCIYGPAPVKRVHTCTKCGYQWETCAMVDEARFCPQCGAPASCEERGCAFGRYF